MRGLSLLLLGAMLAVPSAAAQQAQQAFSPKAQQKFDRVTAGMIAKPTVPCMSTFNAYQTTVIDEQTVASAASAGCPHVVEPSSSGRPPASRRAGVQPGGSQRDCA